ncbi:Gfo/Idh/MocA family protein [Streptomyces sp. NPDC050560]|uniref:Gfo/Idh/MocA family protein n=1 Tax=Streptomyces sp. NPDC050560 TaxID=3365630 RepID=UPI0037A8EF01
MPDTPVLRLAVLGAAHPHVTYALDELPHHDGLALVAVADPDPALAHTHAHPHRVPSYRDHRALLADHGPDVVMVAGIYAQRARAVIDALEAGAHVLADKPLCTTLDDLDAIEEAAARTGRTVSLLLEKRHYPETVAARQLLARGELGELATVAASGPHKLRRAQRPAWFLDRRSYGGIISDLAVHDIDLVLHLSHASEGTVTAVSAPAPDGFPLSGAVLLRAGTLAATIEVSWLTPAAAPWHGDYRMRLTGTRGVAELLWARHTLTAVTDTREPHEVPLPPGRRPGDEALSALAAGRVPEVDTAQSVAVTRIALLAQLSADEGGTPHSWTTRHTSPANGAPS